MYGSFFLIKTTSWAFHWMEWTSKVLERRWNRWDYESGEFLFAKEHKPALNRDSSITKKITEHNINMQFKDLQCNTAAYERE